MKYVLTNNHRNVSNNDLLDDIKEVAKKLQKCTLTVAEYNKNGKYSPNTFYRRFGSWAKVLEQAGLDIDFKNIKISREEYISDLKKVAKALKRKTITRLNIENMEGMIKIGFQNILMGGKMHCLQQD